MLYTKLHFSLDTGMKRGDGGESIYGGDFEGESWIIDKYFTSITNTLTLLTNSFNYNYIIIVKYLSFFLLQLVPIFV